MVTLNLIEKLESIRTPENREVINSAISEIRALRDEKRTVMNAYIKAAERVRLIEEKLASMVIPIE